MALILDKTHTGVTSVDISGNTLTTGYTNLNYSDVFGNVLENPYLVVDDLVIDKSRHFIKVMVSIYKDSTARNESKLPVYRDMVTTTDEDIYNTYFAIENMENKNIFEASYVYVKNVRYIGWKSDED